ncbi:TraR/DksA family transcriptional regulator [Porticoccaceae bacterium]|jgi:DnaK suppressor protein|nr:TraR/DksA family transcriptional regulator [Porticoccaceae bacterium]MDC0000556.1 TraR/DksA family transcriptional regulator [Porticoccaceae bacterium]
MDASVRETFRQQLLDLRRELQELEALSADASKPVQLDQSMVGRLSRIDAMQGAQMAQETSRRRQQQLTGIVGALARIDAGDYGYCTLCDEDISIGRLGIDPTYSLCILCAEKAV